MTCCLRRHGFSLLLALLAALPPAHAANYTNPDSPEARNPALTLVGRWQRRPVRPDYPPVDLTLDGADKVKFAGLHDDWTGAYTPPTKDNPGHLVLRRKPKADEMSTDAPLWARQMVEGQVEWRLELDRSECSGDTLSGKWYPGELEWSDGAHVARLHGEGKPIDITFDAVPAKDKVWASLEAAPLLRIVPPEKPLADVNLDTTVKGRPFLPVIRTSSAMAKKYGRTVTMTLHATKSGGSAEVVMNRYGSENATPVIYMPDEPVVLDDHVGLFGLTPLLGKASRETHRLQVADGELVTATFDKSQASLVVYNSWVQEATAHHKHNIDAAASVYSGMLLDPTATPLLREVAHQKSELIVNFRLLMAYEPKPDETFTDFTRFEIAEAYANMLGDPRIRPDARPQATTHGATPDRYGISYLFDDERTEVYKAIDKGRQRYVDSMQHLESELIIGSYDFFAMQTGAAQFVMVVWGIDTHGQPVDRTDRIFAGIGLGSQLLLVGASTAGSVQKLNNESHLAAAYEQILEDRMIQNEQAELGIETAVPLQELEDVPGRAGPGSAGPSGPAARRPGATSPGLRQGSQANMAREAAQLEAAVDSVTERVYQPQALENRGGPAWEPLYNGDPTFETPIPDKPLNSGGTPMQIADGGCGLAAKEGSMRDAGFVAAPEIENMRKAINRGNFTDLEVNFGKENHKGGGMTAIEMARDFTDEGATVQTMYNVNKKAPWQQIQKGLTQGKHYVAMVNNGTVKSPSLHWVRVEGFSCRAGGRRVHVGDPWNGQSAHMSGDMFNARVRHVIEVDWSTLMKSMGH